MESEEEYARRLLGPLAGELTEPSTVDLDRAILVGGRRWLRQRVATGTALAVATAVAVAVVPMMVNRGSHGVLPEPGTSNSATPTVAQSATPAERPPTPAVLPTDCRVRRLPTPPGTVVSTVSGGDSTGRYVVGRAHLKAAGGKVASLIWDNEHLTMVPTPDSEVILQSVNSHGTAVGNSFFKGRFTPWIYENGVLRELPSVGMEAAASSINDNGVIVGVAYGPKGRQLGRGIPVVWRSSTTPLVALPLPAGAESGSAADVDTDGTIVGSFTSADHRRIAYIWPPGGDGYPLAKPLVDGLMPTDSGVESIRDGWVIGNVEKVGGDGSNSRWAARWDLRTGRSVAFRELPEGANAGNRVGMFVATDAKGRAVLSNGATTVTLPDVSPLTALKNGLANVPRGVSDDGRIIVGQAIDATGNVQAVIWRCD
jgi:hypothetical protein